MVHTPHELRSIFNEKEAAKTQYFGGNAGGAAGGKLYLLPF